MSNIFEPLLLKTIEVVGEWIDRCSQSERTEPLRQWMDGYTLERVCDQANAMADVLLDHPSSVEKIIPNLLVKLCPAWPLDGRRTVVQMARKLVLIEAENILESDEGEEIAAEDLARAGRCPEIAETLEMFDTELALMAIGRDPSLARILAKADAFH